MQLHIGYENKDSDMKVALISYFSLSQKTPKYTKLGKSEGIDL